MLALMGIPGCGKTSLAKLIAARENIMFLPEPVESNPYLEDYYKDPSRYAFNMQVFLLHSMFKHTKQARKFNQCVLDASMHINDIFVEMQYTSGIMSHSDYATYNRLSATLHSMAAPPELVVYLRCSTKTAMERIQKRGRPSELGIPFEYWDKLNNTYENWYDSYFSSKKLVIEVDDIDFVDDENDEEYIIDSIMEWL